jgi:serine/threonine-protein kinase
VNAPTDTWVLDKDDVFSRTFRVEKRLGAGLHGEVYLVEHLFTHDRFALKVMHLEDVREASRVARAMSTAKASYWIRHANVVRVQDIGCEPDGTVWILMEYLEGISVGELLARQQGRVSLWLALHIAIEAAWGIDAAHEMGVIHRDIKPDNLWLTVDGILKVIDFSLAKVVPEGIRTTQRSQGVGTPPYMGPEMLLGGVVIDARADVYALGMVLWQMLAGRHPFHDALSDTKEMVRRQLYVDPEPLSPIAGLPVYVDEFMARALAKEPAKRFLSMAQMARGLMTLRDQLRSDAERGLFDVKIPRGEPRFSNDPLGRQAYIPVQTVTPTGTVPPVPAARIMLGPQVVPQGLGGTLPLPSAETGTTLQQLPPSAQPVQAATAAPPHAQPVSAPTPVVPTRAATAAQTPPPAPTSTPAAGHDRSSGSPAPRSAVDTLRLGDTPQAVMRAPVPSGMSDGPPARRVPKLVVVGLVSALLASTGVAAWSKWTRRAPPHPAEVDTAATAATSAPPVTSTAPPVTAAPQPEPPDASTAATSTPTAPMPTASTTAPAASAASPVGGRAGNRRGPPTVPGSTAHPPPAAAPTTTPAARHRLFDTDP